MKRTDKKERLTRSERIRLAAAAISGAVGGAVRAVVDAVLDAW